MLALCKFIVAVTIASSLGSCAAITQLFHDSENQVKESAMPQCVPYQRDLTRPWGSKRGYCTGERPHHHESIVTTESIRSENIDGLSRANSKVLKGNAAPEGDALLDVTGGAEISRGDRTRLSDDSLLGDRREIFFDHGSTDITPEMENRINQILGSIDKNDVPSVVWLQASLTDDETKKNSIDNDALGIERSLAVKDILLKKGFKDVRIRYSIVDADESTVKIILKSDA